MAGDGDRISIFREVVSSIFDLLSMVVDMSEPKIDVDRLERRLEEIVGSGQRHTDEPYRDTGVFSPSYPSQTREDACMECLERHFAKAHGLLEEAERFSLKHGRITPEAREKIRRAVEEIVTAEDDLGTHVSDEELRRGLDEIRAMQREVRKWMWARGLTTTSESLEDLREAKEMVKKLLDKAYEVAETYRRKQGIECPVCKTAGQPNVKGE
ncbi:MAG: hypothetical protein QXK94_10565 [Candidatus Jordarchaeales archaeon]